MKRLSRPLILPVLLLCMSFVLSLAPPIVRAEGNPPINLTFDKSAVAPGVWEGTVSGDVEGTLTTVLVDLRERGPTWHVEFDWIIGAGDQSFTARLRGILNTQTGRVVMNGTVTEGWLAGAQVHEEGELIDPTTLRFQGTIRVMPASAP